MRPPGPPANFGGMNSSFNSFAGTNLQAQQQQYNNGNFNSGGDAAGGYPAMRPPMEPTMAMPTPPALPPMKNGVNPISTLQDQLNAVKLKAADRASRMVLRAPGGGIGGKGGTPSMKKDVVTTETLLGTLANALAVRRAQLTDNGADEDSDDDWSD